MLGSDRFSYGSLTSVSASRGTHASLPLARLMEESEHTLRQASQGTDAGAQAIRRVLESPLAYRRWEGSHSRLMGRLAELPNTSKQASSALNAVFTLVHGKSLFVYLREEQVRADRRRKLIEHFHGTQGYVRFMVREYGNYLHAEASLQCLRHIGHDLLHAQAFGAPLDGYQVDYATYFRRYCEWAAPEGEARPAEAMPEALMQLKAAVLQQRQDLLNSLR